MLEASIVERSYNGSLFPTAELPKGEREKIDIFLQLLEDSGIGEIIYQETSSYVALSKFLNNLVVKHFEIIFTKITGKRIN